MATRPTRPALSARYDRRRHELLTGAAAVFADRGYDQTPVHELAAALGVAAGGLYHYFGGKEQLLIAICDELMDPLLAEAEALVAAHGTPAAQLRALVRLWVVQVVGHRDHMLVFQQERHVVEREPQWRAVRDRRKRFERVVEDVLRRLDRAGDLRAADPRVALSALLGMVNHTAQWFRPEGRLTPGEVADGYVALLLRAA